MADIELSEKKVEDEDSDSTELEFDNLKQIWRNGLVICTGFLFLFTAYLSLQSLQSSLFIAEGMGTTVVAAIYGSLALSALFIPSPLVRTLGCKWSMVIAMSCYILFMVSHFYASWELFIPAAIVLGVGAAPLWAAKSTYLNTIAHNYAVIKGVSNDAAVGLFFGIFFLFFQSSSIWGNIISSQVLTPDDLNSSINLLSEEELSRCGRAFDPRVFAGNTNNTNFEKPPKNKLYMLAGIYTGCACVAVVIVLLFLQQLPSEAKKKKCGGCSRDTCQPKRIVATFLQLKDYRQLLLIPITMYIGVEQAFFASDYTQAFITCPLGTWWVGYISICYGVVDALCSVFFGKMVQYVGRVPFFTLGATINTGLVITFLSIDVGQDRLYLYFIFAGLWGMCDAVWQTQITALYGVLFKDSSEAAFSSYQLFASIGCIMAFAYQSRLPFPPKAYILLSVLGLGMIGYGIVEYMERRNKKKLMETQ